MYHQGLPLYDSQYIKDNNYDVFDASSDEACLKMLDRQRVDSFLCEAISAARAIENKKARNIEVTKKPVSSFPVYYAVSNNKEGKMLIKIIDKNLSIIKKNGKLRDLFKEAKQKAKRVLIINYDPPLYLKFSLVTPVHFAQNP